MMRVGIACDHGGFKLKCHLMVALRRAGYEVRDFGARDLSPEDDYPDYVLPLAHAVSCGEVQRGVAICGSGVGACILANKIRGVRAALVHEDFSARQGVEDDDMNLICLGGRILEESAGWELVRVFLDARFSGAERHRRRLAKIAAVEQAAEEHGKTPPEATPHR